MTSLLSQIRAMTTVVADTGDFESIELYQPEDATTNPSLLLKAAKMPIYHELVSSVVADVGRLNLSSDEQFSHGTDLLAVRFGEKILDIIPGRVSTEVDARLSFDKKASIAKANKLISMYEESGIGAERVLIKLASTWEGISAAKQLEKNGIQTNLTLLFNFTQAAAAADAGVFLISPFVGRILDWYKANTNSQNLDGANDPGVISVTRIFNYYKQNGYATVVMGASFRSVDQIIELAGCDKLTISPLLLEELSVRGGEITRKLDSGKTGEVINEALINEQRFRFRLNEDAMTNEKLAEGIRSFVSDQRKLEDWLKGL
ncbi:MAG: transaldolase [Cellvibrionales bacterium TMED148]|nr:transaldolase [Porticoccaceae bacterium]RPG88127.1 MAG: transaldolase [Cellvibrionales bacterium TMED148]